MSKAQENIGKVVISLFILVVFVLGLMWTGFCLSSLWGWFVVPLGVNPIGIAHAIGISTVIAMFTYRFQKDETKGVGNAIAIMFVVPLLFLGFGWIVVQFM